MQILKMRRRRPVEPDGRRFSLGDWMSAPDWISVKEAAAISGYDMQYVRMLVRNNKVSAEKKGGHEWWIDKSSLESYVKHMKSLGNDRFNPHLNGGA